MKNKRKVLITILILIILTLLGILSVFIYNSVNDKNKLNLNENRWLENNKYNVIDVTLINNVPILNYNGEGVVYDYFNYLTDNLSLKFNIISYKTDESDKTDVADGVETTKTQYKYKMEIVDSLDKNDIELLKDNMILLTTNDVEYDNISQIDNLKIGVLKSDKELLEQYFDGQNILFIEYDSVDALSSALKDSKANLVAGVSPDIDGIIVLRNLITKEILENDYKISFKFSDLNKYFVLKLNGDKELNDILIKKYTIWKENNYEKGYSDNFLKFYFDVKKISDVDQKKLKSKNYKYGFIDYGVYNYLHNNELAGFNELILKDFNKTFGVSLTYTKYNSLNSLIKNFNSKKIDFILNITNIENEELFSTVGVFSKKYVVISGIDNKDTFDNIKSLKDKNVLTIKYSMIEKYLIDNGIKVKSYNNMSDLMKDFGKDDITLVDLANYDYYKTSGFANSKISYMPIILNDKYTYIVNDTSENEIFEDLFNFYLNYTDIDNLVNSNYNKIVYEKFNFMYLLVLLIIILIIYVIIDFSTHIKVMIKRSKENKKIHLSKEEKLKYIDQLTSLKNRSYLNSKIEMWDASEVYPKAIVIIDLNNISYINDNYGREEGDKVIAEASNILILEQLKNSEIMRTDGNEFLIYLVGYDEKQIVSYIRKLNKQFKGLSHGFGAASGYSIITDAIKTIDDAVNEATISMKENKEDIDY